MPANTPWTVLLSALRAEGMVPVETDIGIDVTWEVPDGASRTRTLVMTERDWEDVVDIYFGSLEAAVEDVLKGLPLLSGAQRYLVYEDYRLVPSASPELPQVEEDWTNIGPGRWYAVAKDGSEVHPFPELPDSPR